MTKEAKAKDKIKVELIINRLTFTATGNDVAETIKSLKVPSYKTAGILTLHMDGKKSQKILTIPRMRQLFGPSEIYRQAVAKGLTLLLK